MGPNDVVFSEYPPPVLVGVGITFMVLPVIVVCLRFFARRFTRVAIGIDDWSIIVALALSTAAGIVEVLLAEIGGLGRHQPSGPGGELKHTQTLTNYEKCRYANLIITTLNLGIIKISILLFYRRLFPVKPFNIASGVMLGIITSWAIAFTSASMGQCNPPAYFWKAFEIDYPRHCIQVQKMYQGLAISDLILDVLVLVLPIPMVISLKLPWKAKIKVIDILLLGGVVLASGIARVTSFFQVVTFTNENPEIYFKDTLYFTSGPLFWIYAENAIAIIGACLPTLAPLWSGKQAKAIEGSSYPSGAWSSSRSKQYKDLTASYSNAHTAGDSDRQLVDVLSAGQIGGGGIPLTDTSENVIKVNKTFHADISC